MPRKRNTSTDKPTKSKAKNMRGTFNPSSSNSVDPISDGDSKELLVINKQKRKRSILANNKVSNAQIVSPKNSKIDYDNAGGQPISSSSRIDKWDQAYNDPIVIYMPKNCGHPGASCHQYNSHATPHTSAFSPPQHSASHSSSLPEYGGDYSHQRHHRQRSQHHRPQKRSNRHRHRFSSDELSQPYAPHTYCHSRGDGLASTDQDWGTPARGTHGDRRGQQLDHHPGLGGADQGWKKRYGRSGQTYGDPFHNENINNNHFKVDDWREDEVNGWDFAADYSDDISRDDTTDQEYMDMPNRYNRYRYSDQIKTRAANDYDDNVSCRDCNIRYRDHMNMQPTQQENDFRNQHNYQYHVPHRHNMNNSSKKPRRLQLKKTRSKSAIRHPSKYEEALNPRSQPNAHEYPHFNPYRVGGVNDGGCYGRSCSVAGVEYPHQTQTTSSEDSSESSSDNESCCSIFTPPDYAGNHRNQPAQLATGNPWPDYDLIAQRSKKKRMKASLARVNKKGKSLSHSKLSNKIARRTF